MWSQIPQTLLLRHTIRFQIMSDLHLETFKEYSTFRIPPSAPYLILAGDIGRLSEYDLYLSFLCSQCERFTKVFLVLGNHEFYGISHQHGLQLAKSLEEDPLLKGKLVILRRTRVDVDAHPNITILGCTLQSHIPPEARQVVERKVKDFQRIAGWTVDDHNAEHNLDVEWLREQISLIRREKNGLTRRIVVVTHHAPALREASKLTDVNNPWSSAFGTDLFRGDNALAFREVQRWIFGHTHYTTKFSKYNVGFISNQRGYVVPAQSTHDAVPVPFLRSMIRPFDLFHQKKDNFSVGRVITV